MDPDVLCPKKANKHNLILSLWTNTGILLIGPLGTNFSEIFIEIHTFSFKKMHLKMSSATWRQFFLGLNVLTFIWGLKHIESPITEPADGLAPYSATSSVGAALTAKLEMPFSPSFFQVWLLDILNSFFNQSKNGQASCTSKWPSTEGRSMS